MAIKLGLINRIEKVLVAAEAELGGADAPLTLGAMVVGADDEEAAKARVLADHLAAHPQDTGRPVEWTLYQIKFVDPLAPRSPEIFVDGSREVN
jgi:hypothetical protein